MRSFSAALVAALALTACAPEPSGAVPVPSEPPTSSVEGWCAGQTPDRCVEALLYLEWNPDKAPCVLASSDESVGFWDLCDEATEIPPATTVPTGGSDPGADTARRIPAVDERALAMLPSTHPDGIVTIGVLLRRPMTLAESERLAVSAGATLIAAWRTDYVCLAGLEEWPVWTASRFAYVDGVERADRLRREMENSSTPVTGAHIPLNAFAVMEQESRALLQPGVHIEAVKLEAPVKALQELRLDPAVGGLRLADFPIDSLDLSDPVRPDCAGD